MHNKTLLFLLLAAAVLFDFTGCAYMSASGRREMAYRHYVQKSIKQRQHAMARAQKVANRELKRKVKSIQPSEPKITASVESAPEPVSEPASTSTSEPVADPITVSASTAIQTETDGAQRQQP